MTKLKSYWDAPANLVIIAVAIIIYLIEIIIAKRIDNIDTYTLVDMGAKWSAAIDAGQYWRFVTPIFLHAGLLHIITNMVTLFFIGPLAEHQFGSLRYLVIYFVSGIIGNISSYLFAPNTVAVGASTAIFGIFGALLMYGWLFWGDVIVRARTTMFLIFVVWNIITQFASSTIDIWGHIGGVMGGFLLAFVLGFKLKEDNRKIMPYQRIIATVALIILIIVLIMVVRP